MLSFVLLVLNLLWEQVGLFGCPHAHTEKLYSPDDVSMHLQYKYGLLLTKHDGKLFFVQIFHKKKRFS